MKQTLLAAAAMTLVGVGAASAAGIKPGTYSISLSPYCDHLTITVDSSGNAYGASDTSGCDQSPVAGSLLTLKGSVQPGGKVIQVSGDLGFGADYGWNWDFNLATSTGTLRGSTGGTLYFPPTNFTISYTKDAVRGVHAHNGGAAVTSVLLRK